MPLDCSDAIALSAIRGVLDGFCVRQLGTALCAPAGQGFECVEWRRLLWALAGDGVSVLWRATAFVGVRI